MGKSAKLYKRGVCSSEYICFMCFNLDLQHKKPKTPGVTPTSATAPVAQQVANAKKKRAKAAPPRTDKSGPVLGGADYVSVMMGGRRKAKEEIAKLSKAP